MHCQQNVKNFSEWLPVKSYDENGYDIAMKAFFTE